MFEKILDKLFPKATYVVCFGDLFGACREVEARTSWGAVRKIVRSHGRCNFMSAMKKEEFEQMLNS